MKAGLRLPRAALVRMPPAPISMCMSKNAWGVSTNRFWLRLRRRVRFYRNIAHFFAAFFTVS